MMGRGTHQETNLCLRSKVSSVRALTHTSLSQYPHLGDGTVKLSRQGELGWALAENTEQNTSLPGKLTSTTIGVLF